MKLNRRQLRRLIESTILEQEGGSTSGSDKAGADRSDPRNVNRALQSAERKKNRPDSFKDRQDHTEHSPYDHAGTHAKDMQADLDLGSIDVLEDINIPAGKSVTFKAHYYYDEGSLETIKGDHTKLAAKIDNSKLIVTDDDEYGRLIAPFDPPGKVVTWYIKNHGNSPVVMRIEEAGP